MRLLYLLVLLLILKSGHAQTFSPELQTMVNAENAFAKYSKEKNTRDAFLLYLTDSTVLFDKSGPIKGKKSWTDRSPDSSLLFWRPLFVGIAKSGDLGFSTGPWEWSPSKEATPEAHGYFASIWKKSHDGWKLALDVGVLLPGPELNPAPLHASNSVATHHEEKSRTKGRDAFLSVDRNYNDKLNKEDVAFIKQDFANEGLVLRNGLFPQYFPFNNLTRTGQKFKFSPLGGDVATSNDLGYSFGRVKFEYTDSGSVKMADANFLRVWKFIEGKWKIVLDVISLPN